MADDPKPKTRVFPLPFEAPEGFGQPVNWLAIAINERGEPYLRAPLDTHPELALALVGEATSLVCQAVAQRLRTALLAERVMQAPEEEPALTQGTA
jgi:hypothetical protein